MKIDMWLFCERPAVGQAAAAVYSAFPTATRTATNIPHKSTLASVLVLERAEGGLLVMGMEDTEVRMATRMEIYASRKLRKRIEGGFDGDRFDR